MADQAAHSCLHPTAYVVASIGDPGNDDPAASGLPWEQIPDHRMVGDTDLSGAVSQLLRQYFRPEGLDGIKAHVSMGICSGCWRPVVTVRMGDHHRWTPEHGPAWSSAWTPLVRDGESSQGRILGPDRAMDGEPRSGA